MPALTKTLRDTQSVNKGLYLDWERRLIPEGGLSDGQNIEVNEHGAVLQGPGWSKFSTTAPPGTTPIMLLSDFVTSAGVRRLMCCTTTRLSRFNTGTLVFDDNTAGVNLLTGTSVTPIFSAALNDLFILTNNTNAIKKSNGTTWADLAGSPPGLALGLDVYEGHLLLWNVTTGGVNVGFRTQWCIAPESRVLKTDLSWARADTLAVGDTLIGFDEYPIGAERQRPRRRKLRRTVVESIKKLVAPSYRIYFEGGSVIASANHQWLVRNCHGQSPVRWKTTEELTQEKHGLGKHKPYLVLRLSAPWEADQSYEAGYLAAAIDGEGAVSTKPRRGYASPTVQIAQAEGDILDRIEAYLRKRSIRFSRLVGKKRPPYKTLVQLVINRLGDAMRLIGETRPQKLRKFVWEGIAPPRDGWVAIDRIESLGNQEVLAIQTSAKTLIVEGLYSHNSDLNAPETWTGGESGTLDIRDENLLHILAGGKMRDEFLLYKQDLGGIYALKYVGLPLIMQQRLIFPRIGILAPKALAVHRDTHFFLGADEQVYAVAPGSNPTPIGDQIRRRLFGRLNYANRYASWVAVNPIRQQLICAIPEGTSSVANRAYIMNLTTGAWGEREFPLQCGAYVQDPRTTTINALTGTIDALVGSIDSLSATSKNVFMVGGEGTSNYVYLYDGQTTMDGTAIDAWAVSGWMGDSGLRNLRVRGFEVDATGAPSADVGLLSTLAGSPVYTQLGNVSSSGRVDANATAPFVSLRVRTQSGMPWIWTGYRPDVFPQGRR